MTFAKAHRRYTDIFRGREESFKKWVEENGGVVHPSTNEWEVVRYRKNGVVSIIYRNKKGRYSLLGRSLDDVDEFTRSVKGEASYKDLEAAGYLAPLEIDLLMRRYEKTRNMKTPTEHQHPMQKPGRSNGEAKRERLRERDGNRCWFCDREMGDDATIEHLRPKAEGGTNRFDNLVLAHTRCNAMAGSWSLGFKHKVAGWLRRHPEFFDPN